MFHRREVYGGMWLARDFFIKQRFSIFQISSDQKPPQNNTNVRLVNERVRGERE